MTIRKLHIAAFCLLVLFAACGGDTSVGEDIDTRKIGSSPGAARLGESEKTPAPKATQRPVQAARATARPKATAAPARNAGPAIVIKIQSDTAAGGSQFEPRVARVQRGATVRWQNVDAKPRSVEADNGAFRSPTIPPGGTWDYVASTPGQFNYHDGTRPYAVGTLQVA